jgi:hypothetical protein
MIWLRILVIGFAAALIFGQPAQARVHAQMFCWTSDSEFPIGCDEDEDDDDDGDLRPTRIPPDAKGSEPLPARALAHSVGRPGV